jgi:hypothetical protein
MSARLATYPTVHPRVRCQSGDEVIDGGKEPRTGTGRLLLVGVRSINDLCLSHAQEPYVHG